MLEQITKINNNLSDIRNAISEQGVEIDASTPLAEYADKILEIERPVVEIGQQLYVFYCNAENTWDAKNKILPSITWNGSGWDVSETIGGWSSTVPDDETGNEKYLYGLFVPIKTEQSSADANFVWPNPVPIQGKTGEKGDTGLPGRDGIVAGMVLYKTVNLYINSSNKPEIEQGDITFHKENQDVYEIFATDLEIDGIRVKDEVEEDDDSGQWYSKYPSATYSDMIWMIQVSFKSDNDNTTPETSPILLTQPVLVVDAIADITAKYSYSNDTSDLNLWSDVPLSPTLDNKTCYVVYIISTKYGEIEQTKPGVYSQFPKSIVDITYEYGVSNSETIAPTVWNSNYPRISDYKAIWQKRTEVFSNGDTKDTKSPIAIKGNNGVGPYRILTRINEGDLNSWTRSQLSILEDKDAVIDKNDVLYCWYGTTRPTWSDELDLYEISINDTTYYWLKLGHMSTYANWDAEEGAPGHIENRTHYVETITEPFGIHDDYWSQVYVPTSAFNIAISNGSETRNWNNVWCISEESLPDGVSFLESINNTYEFDSAGAPWECSYQIIHQLDPKFVPQMIEIKYADLKTLKDKNQLIPGMQYRIIDYNTITVKENTKSAEHQFDLIVTADSVNEINCKARAIQSESVNDHYFDNSDLSKWEIWYDFDNRTNYSWIPEEDSEAGAYKAGTKWELSTEVFTGFDYKTYVSDTIITVRKLKDSDFCINASDISDRRRYLVYDSKGEPTFVPHSDNWWQESYAIMEDFSDYGSVCFHVVFRGQQYTMVPILDEYGGVTVHSFFVVTDAQGHIDDFVQLRFMENDSVIFMHKEAFDVILSRVKEYEEGDMVYFDVLPNWLSTYDAAHLGTTIDTCDFSNIIIAPVDRNSQYFDKVILQDAIHKGTIYRMIDEFGNDCPYDFKNIKFLNDSNEECYTFGSDCHNNTILPYTDNNMYSLNFITLGIRCSNNSFGYGCNNNSFGYDCNNNSLGNNCSNNSLGAACSSNSFGNNCSNNSFDHDCNYNIFGHNCDNRNLSDCTEYTFTSVNSRGVIKEFNLADLVS